MSKTIYKYPLTFVESQQVSLPVGTKVLTVQLQNGIPTLWAMVNQNSEHFEDKTIEMYGTGWPIENTCVGRNYISTIQTDEELVFHFFELR